MNIEHRDNYFVVQLSEFRGSTKGYFLGRFMGEQGYPFLNFEELEIASMELPIVDESKPHYHLVSTEVTIVTEGCLTLIVDQQQEIQLKKGEFVVIPPGTVLQNPVNEPGTKVIVIKFPSIPEDKYYIEK